MLEQAARLLYKEWFVHLRFPGHEHAKIIDGVPEGWEKKHGREVAKRESYGGGTPKYKGVRLLGWRHPLKQGSQRFTTD